MKLWYTHLYQAYIEDTYVYIDCSNSEVLGYVDHSSQARERISSTVKGIIEERRKADCCKRDDFLNVLLSTDELSDEEKVSFVLDSLLGGYETTSPMISMVVYFLGQSAQDLDLVKVHTIPDQA